jgi:hypothetical protein
MSAIRSALLAPTRTQKRAIAYDPSFSRLSISTGRKCGCYQVEEIYAAPGFRGRAFTLTNLESGESYNLLLAEDRYHSTCDCCGHSYGAVAEANRRAVERGEDVVESLGCKHLDAVAHVIDQGWLVDPRSNPEADTGSAITAEELDEMERHFSEMPECFRCLGPSADVPF